jgi:hypothetical protein
VSNLLHVPATSPPPGDKAPSTHFVGDWVDLHGGNGSLLYQPGGGGIYLGYLVSGGYKYGDLALQVVRVSRNGTIKIWS